MKALIKQKQSVSVSEVSTPDLPAAGEVLIRVALTGLCRTDLYVAQGLIKTKDPLILGHEFSGIVEKAGLNVSHVRAGDRVTVMPFFPVANDQVIDLRRTETWHETTMMGLHQDGSFCEYAMVPGYAVYKLPETVSLKLGAYMEPVAASLAVLKADIHPDQMGLIYGDNRIAQLTLRILQCYGFNKVGLYDPAIEGGQDESRDRYDFIIETLAETDTMAAMVRMVKPGGLVVLKSRQHKPVSISINDLVKKNIRMQAVNYGSFAEGIELIANGRLKVDDLLGDVYPLETFENAFQEGNRHETRKIFLTAQDDNVWDL
jgi:L-iditol 2-dehydrogenase